MARGIKTLELTERDIYILFLLDKFRVLDSKSLSILADFTSEQYASTRLQKLARYGYIKREKIVSYLPFIHYLTVTGSDVINDVKKRQIKPKLATLEHELIVGKVASYLYIQTGIQPQNIITDRDLRIYERQVNDIRVMDRKGDLLYFDTVTDERILIEIELTFKGKSRTKENILKNKRISDKQIWFIPKGKKGIEKVLINEGISKENIFFLEELTLDRPLEKRIIDKNIEKYDINQIIKSYFSSNKINSEQNKTSLLDRYSKFT